MSRNPLVSVIVPIYQIDRYIGICVESLINQIYKNLEIILVDDGSTDRSSEICDLYAKKDPRIKVIHKANGGLVSARKAGLEIATGEYIGYVDGDDWCEAGFYDELVDTITKYESDIVVAGMSKDLFSTSSKIISKVPAGNYYGERLDKLKKNMFNFEKFSHIGITTYVWNKLFRREKLLKYQMSVDNSISIGEDAAVTYPYLMECTRVSVIDNCDYHYRQREDSMLKSTTAYNKEVVGLKKLYEHLIDASDDVAHDFNYKKQIRDFVLGICIMRSGGMLSKLRTEYSPYSGEFYGKDIVVYSAGTFGQQLMHRIEENDYCNVVGWLDVDYKEYRRCCLDVDPIENIDFIKYDFVLVATVDVVMAESIKSKLMWRGVPDRKILIVNCPEERREYLLKRYLNIRDKISLKSNLKEK